MEKRVRLTINGTELRKRRLQAVLSRGQLADAAGIASTTVKALEQNGYRGTKPETVQALARALGCEPSDISQVESEVA